MIILHLKKKEKEKEREETEIYLAGRNRSNHPGL